MLYAIIFPYLLLLFWLIYTIIYLKKAFNNFESVNEFLIDLIPSTFTTIGVLGTFIGIAVGLQKFDVNNIDASIPVLLSGLKTAFFTSITGIILSLIFSKIIAFLKGKNETQEKFISGEERALNKLIEQNEQLQKLISGEGDESLTTHLLKLRQVFRDENSKTNECLLNIQTAIGGDSDTSLLSQFTKLREEMYESNKEILKKLNTLNETTKLNSIIMEEKFSEFAQLLEKANTEALVKAIENVIGGFNDRLNELLERLVKENFEELNRSVQNLNNWQKENKEMVERLIAQFKDVAENLEISSESIRNISDSTERLVDADGRLSKLIEELEDVMVENTLFKDSVESLLNATTQFENSSEILSKWIDQEKNLAENVKNLIHNLKEIEELKKNTDGFFDDIKKRMIEGVNIIKEGNSQLMANVNRLEESFNERMDKSFRSLDKVLQAMVTEYAERMKQI